jgi:3-hydroxyacyl-[acyl-carrier-protein] dehydratase
MADDGKGAMDIHEVLEHLPQRFPILMIDRVLECEPGERILALKNVTMNEPHFPGHFPGRPVMPGVMILEAMAQAAGVLVFRTVGQKPDANSVYYYAGIDNARFKRPVVPGDRLLIEVTILGSKRGIWKFACIARVDEAQVAEAEILCTVRTNAPQA